jgi:predicted amidohydrolase
MVQVASPSGEPVAARRDRVGQLVAEASGRDLVVLPELWAPGYFAFDRYEQLAEPPWTALADLGAQTVIVPAASPTARRDHWRLFARAGRWRSRCSTTA